MNPRDQGSADFSHGASPQRKAAPQTLHGASIGSVGGALLAALLSEAGAWLEAMRDNLCELPDRGFRRARQFFVEELNDSLEEMQIPAGVFQLAAASYPKAARLADRLNAAKAEFFEIGESLDQTKSHVFFQRTVALGKMFEALARDCKLLSGEVLGESKASAFGLQIEYTAAEKEQNSDK